MSEKSSANVVLGEDWEDSQSDASKDVPKSRSIWSFRRSPLTRKIVTFNLIALNILVAGVLYLNSSRESLVLQRARALVQEADLVSAVVATGLSNQNTEISPLSANAALNQLTLSKGLRLYVFDRNAEIMTVVDGKRESNIAEFGPTNMPRTPITDSLSFAWGLLKKIIPVSADTHPQNVDMVDLLRKSIEPSLSGNVSFDRFVRGENAADFVATSPIINDGVIVGAVALVSTSGEIDYLVRIERERVLQFFLIGTIVSIALSIALASTISNPLNDLANAAELGRDSHKNRVAPARVRIPDLTARPDEIGRLSSALREMVAALYDRIDTNEQFAADVSHEIKNPLASLRSAVGTLRIAQKPEQRERLLEVIEHDVRRLDRLVSDISNASRLDSELVKEQQEKFDLVQLVQNLADYLGQEAQQKGIEFISDLPDQPIILLGLEARLAQVFVNLITNAVSFCQYGDAIRIWVRTRERRVLIVVEDTGPGIPEEALHKVFQRFYSHRPENDFGNNSGLGLAISKQIVEAHDGVIWAENIRPTLADATSTPLGARFVVGLPL